MGGGRAPGAPPPPRSANGNTSIYFYFQIHLFCVHVCCRHGILMWHVMWDFIRSMPMELTHWECTATVVHGIIPV